MDGIVIINKPSGITSRDVVNTISKKLDTKKVGHTGTLDPLAEGVLVVCVNKGTKVVELLTNHEKDYIATVKLGIETDTQDITGTVLKEEKCILDKDKLINTLNSFNKEYEQTVPVYSAVKINGKKLYEYAREGIEVVLPKRLVKISNMELLEFNNDSFTFKVHVSKGTYIRSLIKDICDELGVLGTMSKLVRIKQGDFSLEDAINLDDPIKLISIDEVLSNLKTIDVDDNLYQKINNGVIYDDNLNDEYIYFRYHNKPLALYKLDDDHKYHMNQYLK